MFISEATEDVLDLASSVQRVPARYRSVVRSVVPKKLTMTA